MDDAVSEAPPATLAQTLTGQNVPLRRTMEWLQANLRPAGLPPVTKALLLVLPIVLVIEWVVAIAFGPESYFVVFTMQPTWVHHPWQLLINGFAHNPLRPFRHLGANMLALWLAGPFVERRLGGAGFGALIVLSAVACSVAQVELVPIPANGFSGSDMAILAAAFGFIVRESHARGAIRQMWYPIVILATATIGMVGIAIYGLLDGSQSDASVAHLAGVVIGSWTGWVLPPRGM